ncbi:MAG: glycosyltransferase, partial [Acidobacteria bacterium]|nr:glycosyltransferase [Acidobacteriota bacterium]
MKARPATSPPLVSVVLRTKDRPRFLAEALDSLRSQTFRDFETLVVNDGAPLAAEVAADERVRIVVPEAPGGRTRALNTGLRAARGSFVAYLDDDDLFEPGHLEHLVAAASQDGVVGAYSDAMLIVQTTDGAGHYREERRQPIFGREFDADRLLFSNYIPLICLLHRREAALEAGLFDETFDLFEDWD